MRYDDYDDISVGRELGKLLFAGLFFFVMFVLMSGIW